MRKRKMKDEVQIRFSKLGENEKQKAKFKSVFQCHAKTKNVNGTWISFSHAIEKRLALSYTHSEDRNPPITAHTLTSVWPSCFLRGQVCCTDYWQQKSVQTCNSLFGFELQNSPALDSSALVAGHGYKMVLCPHSGRPNYLSSTLLRQHWADATFAKGA